MTFFQSVMWGSTKKSGPINSAILKNLLDINKQTPRQAEYKTFDIQ